MKHLAIAIGVCALLLAGGTASAEEWSKETLDVAAHLPVQDDGRVKPLSTMAGFSMLRIYHKRTFRGEEGTRKPTEWLLDTILDPAAARKERIFFVENRDVIDALGLSRGDKSRRDHWSFEELLPARSRLYQLGDEYARIDAKERTPVQGQVLLLSHNVTEFERLLAFLQFARTGVAVDPERFEGRRSVRVSEALRALPTLPAGDARKVRRSIRRSLGTAYAIALFPPLDGGETWLTPRDLGEFRMPVAPQHLEMLEALEEFAAQRDDRIARAAALSALSRRTGKVAEARGELDKIGLEVSYYRLDPFYRSLVLYILAFLLVAITWIKPNLKWLNWAVLLTIGAGLLLHSTGIVLRSILRGRPPVTTLYETVLFTGAVAVLSALVLERINRRRIAIAAAPILGALSLFVAMRYEGLNRADTMPQLVAVLDTNFWLATHVTCIVIGYGAGLLAAALAHVYVLGKVVGLKKNDESFYHGIARMTYGVLCFALLFSVVGTILGGVWANESWGRFWGWDPKENGALMIVLTQIAILHGRLGGYLRDRGICMAAIFQGIVVAFSWWGVNLLGVGLHSYGFTDGVWTGLLAFYGIEGAVILVGVIDWWIRRSRGSVRAKAHPA